MFYWLSQLKKTLKDIGIGQCCQRREREESLVQEKETGTKMKNELDTHGTIDIKDHIFIFKEQIKPRSNVIYDRYQYRYKCENCDLTIDKDILKRDPNNSIYFIKYPYRFAILRDYIYIPTCTEMIVKNIIE